MAGKMQSCGLSLPCGRQNGGIMFEDTPSSSIIEVGRWVLNAGSKIALASNDIFGRATKCCLSNYGLIVMADVEANE